jgi:hypothetical protein
MIRVCAAGLMLAACDQDVYTDPGTDPARAVGYLTASVPLAGGGRDVTAVKVDVVAPDAACGTPALASALVIVASGGESSAGAARTGLMVLPAGTYKVCATPLSNEGPSATCAPVEAAATVAAGQTAEVLLVSQCTGTPSGAIDVTVGLNDPPQLTSVNVAPGKTISVCDSATLSASATDADGDALGFSWSVSAGGRVRATGAATAAFSAPAAGTFLVEVAVTDGRGGRAALSFPLAVVDAVCAAPDAVQAVVTGFCAPCHTTGMSGGLKMDTAQATFANLVGRMAAGAGCTDRVRVVPGDPAASYLMAKLENRPPICGVPMPRGRPMLAPAELQVLSDWIAGLPH